MSSPFTRPSDNAATNQRIASQLAEVMHDSATANRVHREVKREAECESAGNARWPGVLRARRGRASRLPDGLAWWLSVLVHWLGDVLPGVVVIRGKLRLTWWGHFARVAFCLALVAVPVALLSLHGAGVSMMTLTAVPRPVSRSWAALQGKYYGRHWGAKAEAANALPGLDALYDACAAASPIGGEIILAPGTYTTSTYGGGTSATWVMSNGALSAGSRGLTGAKLSAHGATIVSTDMTHKVVRFEDWHDFTVEGLAVQHSNATLRISDGYGAYVLTCRDGTFTKCRFTNVSAMALLLTACTRVDVANCTVGWNHADGIHFSSCWGCGATANRIFYPGDDGIAAYSVENGTVNPELQTAGDAYPRWSKDLTYTGNRIYGVNPAALHGGRGVCFIGVRGGTATGNVIDSVDYAAVLVKCDRSNGDGYGNTDITVSGNSGISSGRNASNTYGAVDIASGGLGTDGSGVDVQANKRVKIAANLFYNHAGSSYLKIVGAGCTGIYANSNTMTTGGGTPPNQNGVEVTTSADRVFLNDNDLILIGKSGYAVDTSVVFCSIKGGTVYKPNQRNNANLAYGVDNSALAGTIEDVSVVADTTLSNALKGTYNTVKFTVRRPVPSWKTVSGNYTITPLDFGRVLNVTAAAVITFPAFDGTYDIPAGEVVTIRRNTSGAVSIANDGTSIIKSRSSLTSVGSQDGGVSVEMTSTANTYWAAGDLA